MKNFATAAQHQRTALMHDKLARTCVPSATPAKQAPFVYHSDPRRGATFARPLGSTLGDASQPRLIKRA